MTTLRFDAIARTFAQRRATRQATPGSDVAKTTYLFVQSFMSGTIAPSADGEGRYTVTLEQGPGQTLYFGDRPSRDVGITPTSQFLQGLGFSEENPPNAALLVETGDGVTGIAVVELYNPVYDESTHTATYDVAPLGSWQDGPGLEPVESPADLASLAAEFGPAHLFIDDCDTVTVTCIDHVANDVMAGVYTVDACWNYAVCMPCEPYGHVQPDRCSTEDYWTTKCNRDHPACHGQCVASFSYPFASC